MLAQRSPSFQGRAQPAQFTGWDRLFGGGLETRCQAVGGVELGGRGEVDMETLLNERQGQGQGVTPVIKGGAEGLQVDDGLDLRGR